MEPAETHPDRLIDFWDWLVENRTQVILAILIAIGAVLIVYTKRLNTRLTEEEAGEAMMVAMDSTGAFILAGQTNQSASASARYANVVSQHSGTAAARNAHFLQASALFDEGKFKDAAATFAAYAAANPQSPLQAAAALGQAACKAALNDPGTSAAYEAVRSQHAGTPEAVQATLALGRMALAAADEAKARELLTIVSTNRISSLWGGEARRMLNRLPKVEGPVEEK